MVLLTEGEVWGKIMLGMEIKIVTFGHVKFKIPL